MIKNKKSTDDSAINSADDNNQYFVMGKVRIKITEHFAKEGKSLTNLLGDAILHAAAY